MFFEFCDRAFFQARLLHSLLVHDLHDLTLKSTRTKKTEKNRNKTALYSESSLSSNPDRSADWSRDRESAYSISARWQNTY